LGFRFLEQHGHRTVRLEVAGAHRLPVARIPNDDVGKPLEVVEVAGEAEDRHFEATVMSKLSSAEAIATPPSEDTIERKRGRSCPSRAPATRRVEPERIAPVDVIVDQRGERP
jgi:hypothetical protein